jgi:hypothetical protein
MFFLPFTFEHFDDHVDHLIIAWVFLADSVECGGNVHVALLSKVSTSNTTRRVRVHRVMISYVVIYIRVRDLGDDLEFEGPFVGKQTLTRAEAVLAAKEVVDDSRHTVTVPNIFEFPDEEAIEEVIARGKKYFDRIKKNMTESKEILERPNRKR